MFGQRRSSTTTTPVINSHVLLFICRADQLRVRERRNYNRYMLVTKKFVAADSPERLQWQKESTDDAQRDVAWNRRHGPVPGGANILPWRNREKDARISASAKRIGG
jgi:hypothetical protein